MHFTKKGCNCLFNTGAFCCTNLCLFLGNLKSYERKYSRIQQDRKIAAKVWKLKIAQTLAISSPYTKLFIFMLFICQVNFCFGRKWPLDNKFRCWSREISTWKLAVFKQTARLYYKARGHPLIISLFFISFGIFFRFFFFFFFFDSHDFEKITTSRLEGPERNPTVSLWT